MKPSAKISVIVPIYKVEQYINQCLDALVNQTLPDIEIICVDDCGPDKSMDIVREYAKSDSRIKILTHEQNSGLSACRNTGIENSSAPYIMCCDSDDWYEPDMCEKMYNAIDASGADAAVCGTNVIYEVDEQEREGDKIYFDVGAAGIYPMSQDFRCHKNVVAWNKIYKRSIIMEKYCRFPVGLKYEDEYFWRAYSSWCKDIYVVPNKLYNYRRRIGSIMNTTFANAAANASGVFKIAIKYYEYAKAYEWLNERILAEFWDVLYTKWLGVAKWHSRNSMDTWEKIQKESRLFILAHYPFGIYDEIIDRKIIDLLDKNTNSTRYYLGKIIRIQDDLGIKRYKLGGTTIVKIKYYKARKHIYFLGAKIVSIYTGPKTTFKKAHFKPFHFDDKQLLSELRQLGKFTYIPNRGNMGDMLIAAATFGFFKKNHIKFNKYKGKTADVLVYGGGGIWVPDYEADWVRFLPLFNAARKIVILPSTFKDCQKLIDVMDERFVVFCREHRSYNYLKSKNTKAKILLDHDMAFHISRTALHFKSHRNHEERKLLRQLNKIKIVRVMKFMRSDAESVQRCGSDMDLSGYVFRDEYTSFRRAAFVAQQMLAVVDKADIVITDRLHVSIAASLMGKRVYMLDNSNKKLSGVYEHSMKHFSNVHFCETLLDSE